MCFPSGYLAPKRMAERPKPAPSGKYGRLVPDPSRNCQIQGVSLVLARLAEGGQAQSHFGSGDPGNLVFRGRPFLEA
jgi:hypothetical protein